MVSRRHQSPGQTAGTGNLPRTPRYPLDAGLHHGHAGSPAASQRALPGVRGALPASSGRGAAMKSAHPFPNLLRAFFYEWMVQQRNASVHTVRSYRDTWRLFLRFVAHRRRRTVAQLTLTDLTAHEVSAFLHHTEQERGDT